MKYIHPFPARMAPEIAFNSLSNLTSKSIVLDPMCGSGMVLRAASEMGYKSIGCDIDPLAILISRVSVRRYDEVRSLKSAEKFLKYAKALDGRSIVLEWIDNDFDTKNFISYWFGSKQRLQLRKLARELVENNAKLDKQVLDLFRVAISRLIVTKKATASLAQDTSHSRPHKVLDDSPYDIFSEFVRSVKSVLKITSQRTGKGMCSIYQRDATQTKLKDGAVDLIITSPPYLNAIDYMRAHKFSLIWFGYSLDQLKKISTASIGFESSNRRGDSDKFIKDHGLNVLNARQKSTIENYVMDAHRQVLESYRVLRKGGQACYVIGDSRLKGRIVPNHLAFVDAANRIGLDIVSVTRRKIPERSRYLPTPTRNGSSLGQRMKLERVIVFEK